MATKVAFLSFLLCISLATCGLSAIDIQVTAQRIAADTNDPVGTDLYLYIVNMSKSDLHDFTGQVQAYDKSGKSIQNGSFPFHFDEFDAGKSLDLFVNYLSISPKRVASWKFVNLIATNKEGTEDLSPQFKFVYIDKTKASHKSNSRKK